MGMVKRGFLEEKEFSLGQKGKNNNNIYIYTRVEGSSGGCRLSPGLEGCHQAAGSCLLSQTTALSSDALTQHLTACFPPSCTTSIGIAELGQCLGNLQALPQGCDKREMSLPFDFSLHSRCHQGLSPNIPSCLMHPAEDLLMSLPASHPRSAARALHTEEDFPHPHARVPSSHLHT